MVDIDSTFSGQATQNMWIGLNDIDNEGQLTWKNGETFYFADWSGDGDENDDDLDCVSLTKSDFKFRNESCDNKEINGYLCMKGSISKFYSPSLVFKLKCLI